MPNFDPASKAATVQVDNMAHVTTGPDIDQLVLSKALDGRTFAKQSPAAQLAQALERALGTEHASAPYIRRLQLNGEPVAGTS